MINGQYEYLNEGSAKQRIDMINGQYEYLNEGSAPIQLVGCHYLLGSLWYISSRPTGGTRTVCLLLYRSAALVAPLTSTVE